MTTSTIEELKFKADECFASGDWSQSENFYNQAIEIIESGADNSNSLLLAQLLNGLSNLLYLKERHDDAKKCCEQVLSLIEEFKIDKHDLHIESLLRMAETMSFYENMEETLQYLEDAENICKSKKGATDPKLATILSTRAAFVLSSEDQDSFGNVDQLISEAENILKSNDIKSGEDLANVLSTKAICFQLDGVVDLAQTYYVEALEALENEPYSSCFGEACFGYATLRATDSRFGESVKFLIDQIEKKEVKIGKDHPILKRAISALALTYSACGELEEAEIQAQRYNQIVEMMGNPGGELKIDCLRILIDILQQQSRLSEAQVLLARANDIAESIGNTSILIRLSMDFARLKLDLGEYDEGINLYQKALNIVKKSKGENHFETAICLGALGNAYFTNNQFKQAEEAIKESIELSSKQEEFFENLIGPDNYRNLGLIYLHQTKLDQAEDAFLKALSILESTNKEDTLQAAETTKNMGELYEVKEEFELARIHYERALGLTKKILGSNNFEVADYISYVADLLKRQKNFQEAEAFYKEALSILESTLGPVHPRTCNLLQRFGEVFIEQEDYEQAKGYFMKALTGMEQTLGSGHPDVGYTSYCLGATYHWMERYVDAEKYYRRALTIKENQLGKKHIDLKTIIEPLIAVLQSQGKQEQATSLNQRIIEITGYEH